MSDYFYILTLIDGKPGPLRSAENWDKALDVAVESVKATSDSSDASLCSDQAIRVELEQDANWCSNQGDIWVYILQSEP